MRSRMTNTFFRVCIFGFSLCLVVLGHLLHMAVNVKRRRNVWCKCFVVYAFKVEVDFLVRLLVFALLLVVKL